jgi:hypothetical protein
MYLKTIGEYTGFLFQLSILFYFNYLFYFISIVYIRWKAPILKIKKQSHYQYQ